MLFASLVGDAFAALGFLIVMAVVGAGALVAVVLNSKAGREAAAGFFARKTPPTTP